MIYDVLTVTCSKEGTCSFILPASWIMEHGISDKRLAHHGKAFQNETTKHLMHLPAVRQDPAMQNAQVLAVFQHTWSVVLDRNTEFETAPQSDSAILEKDRNRSGHTWKQELYVYVQYVYQVWARDSSTSMASKQSRWEALFLCTTLSVCKWDIIIPLMHGILMLLQILSMSVMSYEQHGDMFVFTDFPSTVTLTNGVCGSSKPICTVVSSNCSLAVSHLWRQSLQEADFLNRHEWPVRCTCSTHPTTRSVSHFWQGTIHRTGSVSPGRKLGWSQANFAIWTAHSSPSGVNFALHLHSELI